MDENDGYDWVEDSDQEADWIKATSWDLPTDLRQLVLGLAAPDDLQAQKAALSKLMNLPAWEACPPMLRKQAGRFLAGAEPIR